MCPRFEKQVVLRDAIRGTAREFCTIARVVDDVVVHDITRAKPRGRTAVAVVTSKFDPCSACGVVYLVMVKVVVMASQG